LPEAEYRRILPDLEPTRLSYNQVVYECEEPIRYVYFPVDALVSILAILEDGATVEVGMVGCGGMVGIPAILGATRASHWTITQVAGDAMRMETRALKHWFNESGPFHTQLTRYYRALVSQISQRAVCNARHIVLQRLCTWLLMVRDRVGSDYLPLTQDLIARRLGSRRASVTKAVNDLQSLGLISHGRGYTTIIDGRRLEALACECYRIISTEVEETFTS
jgi:CRP-like cAMP-binding protein